MRTLACILSLSLLAFAGGCARLGEAYVPAPLPEGAPSAADVLADLAANEAALENFQATGTFILIAPELGPAQVLRQSSIAYRHPDGLSVIGRKHGTTVMILTAQGAEFLVEFPTERDYYYRIEGERFESVPFSVAPPDIVREMFFPEPWSALPAEAAHLIGFDVAAQRAELLIGDPRAPRRRVTAEGPPWVAVRNERFDEDGGVVAVTEKRDYRIVDGLRFPGEIEARFPGEGAEMRLAFRRIHINTELDEADFDVRGRAWAVHEYLTREHGRR